jgi:hypothetical protein
MHLVSIISSAWLCFQRACYLPCKYHSLCMKWCSMALKKCIGMRNAISNLNQCSRPRQSNNYAAQIPGMQPQLPRKITTPDASGKRTRQIDLSRLSHLVEGEWRYFDEHIRRGHGSCLTKIRRVVAEEGRPGSDDGGTHSRLIGGGGAHSPAVYAPTSKGCGVRISIAPSAHVRRARTTYVSTHRIWAARCTTFAGACNPCCLCWR